MPDAPRQKAPLGLIAFLLVAACIVGVAKWLWLDRLREDVLAEEKAPPESITPE